MATGSQAAARERLQAAKYRTGRAQYETRCDSCRSSGRPRPRKRRLARSARRLRTTTSRSKSEKPSFLYAMTITTTREQRRRLARDNAKMQDWLTDVPRDEWPRDGMQLRVLRSREFLVQIYSAPAPAVVRLSVNRTTLSGERWSDGVSWDDLQRIKAECGYALHDAVEVYPDARDVVNVANMRHLWVMGEPLPFAWRARR